MKKLLCALLILCTVNANAGPGDVYIQQMKLDEGGIQTHALIPPASNASGIFIYKGSSQVPTYALFDSSISYNGTTLSVPIPTIDYNNLTNKPVPAYGGPVNRTLSLATAYQATTASSPTTFTINITSTSSISLTGTTNNEGGIWIGSTNDVASGVGTKICDYKNTFSGTVVVGFTLSTTQTQTCVINLPANWYIAVRQTVGSGLTIASAFDQTMN